MLSNVIQALRRRVGPVGLSLVAAALTAVAFAAVSVAKDDNGKAGGNGSGNGEAQRAGPGGGAPPMLKDLSAKDREALASFRTCMQEQGVEPPPRPGSGQQGDTRPEPPSEAERAEIEKALKVCEDKLPEGVQPPGPHGGPCGPHPGGDADGARPPAPPQGQGSEQQGAPAPQTEGAAA